ncbi:MAG: hypothetical protein FD143_98 [Ignavibacteria bacterium]|nr:MAG: hypothetical protein FD143_98 [Ignavibacteria bacterium]KAF0162487.1 MAG: hypothetical protein FD188_90 [Ignavibacteria bacterium]
MKKSLLLLKDISINLKIESIGTIEKVVTVDTLIKVLSDIKKSFHQFSEYKLVNNPIYKEYLVGKPKFLEEFLDNFQLLIVDAKMGSFQPALAPNLLEQQDPFFKNEVLEFKKTTFDNFKNDVVYINYLDQQQVNEIVSKYPEEFRSRVYKPFIDTISDDKSYHVHLLDKNDKIIKRIVPPDELRKKQIIPIVKLEKPKSEEQLIKGYFRVSSFGSQIELKKSSIKKVYDIEVLHHETYPFKPDTIRFDNHIFILQSALVCDVNFEDDSYFITNHDLDITVWGNTREETEQAFCFSFYSLYKNYVEEIEENLSEKAIELKNKLNILIKSHYYEAPKN